jgi:hypothetical protein
MVVFLEGRRESRKEQRKQKSGDGRTVLTHRHDRWFGFERREDANCRKSAMGTHLNLDGIRPRQSRCSACGYAPDGVAIRARQVTCPECGAAIRFDLDPPRISRGVRRLAWILWVLSGVLLLTLGVGVWHSGGTIAALAYAGTIAVTTMFVRICSTRVGRREKTGD